MMPALKVVARRVPALPLPIPTNPKGRKTREHPHEHIVVHGNIVERGRASSVKDAAHCSWCRPSHAADRL
jgi:hypothetical protein